jgi:hypothetical protein
LEVCLHKRKVPPSGCGHWTCYGVCPHPPIQLLGSAYYQQYLIMEQEKESRLFPLDPQFQTIRDLKISLLQYLNDGYTVNLEIDVNELDTHLYRPPTCNIHLTTPLGFNYDSRISGSIAEISEACDLVNIHTLNTWKHQQRTHKARNKFISISFRAHS